MEMLRDSFNMALFLFKLWYNYYLLFSRSLFISINKALAFVFSHLKNLVIVGYIIHLYDGSVYVVVVAKMHNSSTEPKMHFEIKK